MFFDSEVEIYYDLLKNDQILSQCGIHDFQLSGSSGEVSECPTANNFHMYQSDVFRSTTYIELSSHIGAMSLVVI